MTTITSAGFTATSSDFVNDFVKIFGGMVRADTAANLRANAEISFYIVRARGARSHILSRSKGLPFQNLL